MGRPDLAMSRWRWLPLVSLVLMTVMALIGG